MRRTTERSGKAWVELLGGMRGRRSNLSVDGAMVPLLHGEWAEVKTLVIGTLEDPVPEGEAHARELSYFSRMMDHQSFARLATVETHRRGTARAERVCAVMDGAWQQKFIDLHRPDAVRRTGEIMLAPVAPVETRRAGRGAGQSQGSVPRAGKEGEWGG